MRSLLLLALTVCAWGQDYHGKSATMFMQDYTEAPCPPNSLHAEPCLYALPVVARHPRLPMVEPLPAPSGTITYAYPQPCPTGTYLASHADHLVCSEPFAVPAIQEKRVQHPKGDAFGCGDNLCIASEDIYEDYWTCADKSRFLLTSEDGLKRVCVRF